ncbi:phage tail tube protein [Georgenia faecalis]|uniref:phage tail tube protein n=1 Tax=Georgenia faecalis TaxID=2483799 RepID=UPI000FD92200|nr:hypothetical protein [Georgenia faecalis]
MSTPTLEPTVNSAWKLDVQAATPATFTPVRAINSLNPTVNYTTQDASDFDSEGWGSDAITQRKWQVTATVLRKIASGTTEDPGQARLRAAADAVELVTVRFYDSSFPGGEAFEGDCYVQWAPAGGPGTGLQSVNITLLGQGERRKIANPTAEG